MDDARVPTVQLHRWLTRMWEGDKGAGDDLLRTFAGRLESVARKMLGDSLRSSAGRRPTTSSRTL